MLAAIIYVYNPRPAPSTIARSWRSVRGRFGSRSALKNCCCSSLLRGLRHQGPVFPLHTWLPDAHVEAPTAGYHHAGFRHAEDGHLRTGALLPAAVSRRRARLRPWIVVLAIIGIIYGALVAMVQPNMKKLVAYSSVSHLGFVVLGIFSFTQSGLDGAVYQMLNSRHLHRRALRAGRVIYERRHSLSDRDYGGVATLAPWPWHGLPDHHAGQHRVCRR